MIVDLVRERSQEYRTPPEPIWTHRAASRVLSIEGKGAPGGPEFQRRLKALFSIAYGTKFDAKRRGADFRVPPLEGEWHLPERRRGGRPDPSRLRWRLEIPVPGFVRSSWVEETRRAAARKRPADELAQVHLSRRPRGRFVQLLHVGPYSSESPDLERMSRFAREGGYRPARFHQEIYLSDPRRVPPSRLRTILRRPVLGRPPQRGRAVRRTGTASPSQ